MMLTMNMRGKEKTIVYVERERQKEFVLDDAAEEARRRDEEAAHARAISAAIASRLELIAQDQPEGLELAFTAVCDELNASQGAFYLFNPQNRLLEYATGYAYFAGEGHKSYYEVGEGLIGQVAKEYKLLNINVVPTGYITILSGLGSASPSHLLLVPLANEAQQLVAVFEIAAFTPFTAAIEELIASISQPLLGYVLAHQPSITA
jgi:hypothetical protein